LRRSLILAVICMMFSSLGMASQTRRKATPKRSAHPSSSYADKEQAEIRAGRERIASQIKTLTQFIYLLGGVSKSIENAELANRNREDSSVSLSVEQIDRNKAKVKDSIRNVRAGLEGLESSFRTNPVLQNYYPNIAGVAKLGQTAEGQAGFSNLDQAGRSLIAAVNKLADALVSLR
jgi:hypothetical protein